MRRYHPFSVAPLALGVILTSLAGCSSLDILDSLPSLDSLNPFSSSTKVKMADLPAIKQSVDVKVLWSEKKNR